jgi:hypothetical protein
MGKIKPIPKKQLEQEFQECVKAACVSLAEICYQRVMRNPEEGMRYLSDLARSLDCKLTADMKLDKPR